jgi:hypothetical protein
MNYWQYPGYQKYVFNIINIWCLNNVCFVVFKVQW